jgi:ABC-type antimicrobial peptide transport system permease subunit
MRMVLFRAGRTAVVGVVGGLVGGVAVGRILRATLFQVAPTDVATLVGASLVLLATVVVAAYGPARQATRVDPATCLRQE